MFGFLPTSDQGWNGFRLIEHRLRSRMGQVLWFHESSTLTFGISFWLIWRAVDDHRRFEVFFPRTDWAFELRIVVVWLARVVALVALSFMSKNNSPLKLTVAWTTKWGGLLFNGNTKSFNLLPQAFVMRNRHVTALIPNTSIRFRFGFVLFWAFQQTGVYSEEYWHYYMTSDSFKVQVPFYYRRFWEGRGTAPNMLAPNMLATSLSIVRSGRSGTRSLKQSGLLGFSNYLKTLLTSFHETELTNSKKLGC